MAQARARECLLCASAERLVAGTRGPAAVASCQSCVCVRVRQRCAAREFFSFSLLVHALLDLVFPAASREPRLPTPASKPTRASARRLLLLLKWLAPTLPLPDADSCSHSSGYLPTHLCLCLCLPYTQSRPVCLMHSPCDRCRCRCLRPSSGATCERDARLVSSRLASPCVCACSLSSEALAASDSARS